MPHAGVSTCLVSAAIVIALPLGAQTRPNFVGKWILVAEKSTPTTPERHQREITIAQDAQTITLTQIAFRVTSPVMVSSGGASTPPAREEFQYLTTYECDGTEHPTPPPTGPNVPVMTPPTLPPGAVVSTMGTSESTYRAIWTRDQLVIMTRSTRTFTPSNAAASATRSVTRKALSLDADGQLVVDSITVAEPTPNGPTQAAPAPLRSVYRKGS